MMDLLEILFLALTAINFILIVANSLGHFVSYLNQHKYVILHIDVEKKVLYLAMSFCAYWTLYRFNEGYTETLTWGWIGLIYPTYHYIKKYFIGFKDVNKLIQWSLDKNKYKYLNFFENSLIEIAMSFSFFLFLSLIFNVYHYQIYVIILMSLWLIKTAVNLYEFKTFIDYKDEKNLSKKDLNLDNLPKFPLHFFHWILTVDSEISTYYLETERRKKGVSSINRQEMEKIIIPRLINRKQYKGLVKGYKNYDRNPLIPEHIKKQVFKIVQIIENNLILNNNEVEQLLLKNSKSTDFYSFDKEDYVIYKNDYKRMTKKEKEFLDNYKMELLKIFDNKCAKTGKSEQIEMDHFFIPKNEGGTFLMQRKNGLKIVNAIPLCKTVNTQKGLIPVKEFFSTEELEIIMKKLNTLNRKINAGLIDE